MDTLSTYGQEVDGEQDEESRLLADAFRRYIKEDAEEADGDLGKYIKILS